MTAPVTRPSPYIRSLLYALMKMIVPLWFTTFYRIEVRGRDNLPDAGPVILLPKHQYWTDVPLVGLAFSGVPLNYIAKKELFRIPLISRFLVALGGIPLDRQAPIKSLHSFKYLDYLLKNGEKVVIFPEGTYYPGVVGRGKSRLIGMVLAFQEKGNYPVPIPFIPVGMRYGRERVRRRVKIVIGTPLYAARGAEATAFTRIIMEAIGRLSEMDIAQ